MAILRQTLFVTGGRSLQLSPPLPPSSLIENNSNTPSGTHDGSDATKDSFTLQTLTGTKGAAAQVIINYQFTPCVVPNIAFIRAIFRGRYIGNHVPPYVLVDNRSSLSPDQIITTTYAEYVVDIPFDLVNGGIIWTAANVDSAGWNITMGFQTFPPTPDSMTIEVSEVRLEVYSELPLTTYDMEVNIGSGFIKESIGEVHSLDALKRIVQNNPRSSPQRY